MTLFPIHIPGIPAVPAVIPQLQVIRRISALFKALIPPVSEKGCLLLKRSGSLDIINHHPSGRLCHGSGNFIRQPCNLRYFLKYFPDPLILLSLIFQLSLLVNPHQGLILRITERHLPLPPSFSGSSAMRNHRCLLTVPQNYGTGFRSPAASWEAPAVRRTGWSLPLPCCLRLS